MLENAMTSLKDNINNVSFNLDESFIAPNSSRLRPEQDPSQLSIIKREHSGDEFNKVKIEHSSLSKKTESFQVQQKKSEEP